MDASSSSAGPVVGQPIMEAAALQNTPPAGDGANLPDAPAYLGAPQLAGRSNPYDLSTWDVKDWMGVSGFFLSLLIAVVAVSRALMRWWRNKMKLRIEILDLPGRWIGRSSMDRFGFNVHHDRGPTFRLEDVWLTWNCRSLTASERADLKARKLGREPDDFPRRMALPPISQSMDGDIRPVIGPGDTFQCDTEVSVAFPWEIVDPKTFRALVEVRSQGKTVYTFDVTERLRAAIPHYVEWRRGNGNTIIDVATRKIEAQPWPFD